MQASCAWTYRAGMAGRVVIAAVAAAATLSGCAPLGRLLGPPQGLSRSAIVLDVPLQRQISEAGCGPAAIAMITGYYRVPIGAPAGRALAARARATGGLSGAALADTLRRAGYFVAIFSGTLRHGVTGIDHNIDRGRPLIIMFRQGRAPVGHYVVVVGHDPIRHLFVILDPALGRMAATWHGLLTRWNATGRFTLLAVPQRPGPR